MNSVIAVFSCLALLASSFVGMGGVASAATEKHPEFEVTRHDLEFILRQIKISESHAAGGDLLCSNRADLSYTCVPDPKLPWGLRTVDGSYNNLQPDQQHFGAGGEVFPRLLEPEYRDAEDLPFDPDGPVGPAQSGVPTSYKQKNGFVADSEPRIISNLIADQTAGNPAAVAAAADVPNSQQFDHDANPATPDRIFIPNEAPDEGLSAPFSSWFTLFGQFFDHGLDLVSKGGSGTVAVPLKPDDALYDHTPGARTNFIMLTRATNQPGEDGVLGTEDDVQEHTNRTTPYIDQNQTYTSHPSHQVFLREYEATQDGPVPTGHLLDGADGGLVTWSEIKAQARTLLGIELDDLDVLNVPMVAADPYGRFIAGPNGYPQLVVPVDPDQPDTTQNRRLVEGNPDAPVDATQALEVNHAFLDDIAHAATPLSSQGAPLTADADGAVGIGDPSVRNVYDDELLGIHYITGDGRGNENIGLSAVHHVFHSEHNRLVGHIDDVLAATGDQTFIDQWHDESGPRGWDYGERLFQAARFVTEMEYQHLAVEEFARKVQPTIDNQPTNETAYHSEINPAVTAEFAHVVYRFGHSMLTDEVAREGGLSVQEDGTRVPFQAESLSLLDAFLNPLALTDGGRLTPDQGAAAVIQGMAKQTGNAIDEFVDDTLRNELLGLPLDLAAINLARGRDTGMPSLQAARRAFYEATNDAAVKPYESWEDFRLSMKHRDSIVNFVAAYGDHASIASATTVAGKRTAAQALVADPAFMNAPAADTGLNDVDFWMGGLAEEGMVFGGLLGTTFNYVFEQHMESLQNADRFYYLTRTQGLNLLHQLENNSFSELVMRNTDATLLHADIFSDPDAVLDLGNVSNPLPPGFIRMSDGTYRYDGEEHIVIHGTDADEGIRGGAGDDSLWGHSGADRVEGGMGNDTLHGGPGNDIITDLFGDDTIHAGGGDDAINAGSGADLLFGGAGRDFALHGNEITQSFAGGGNDFVRGGNANDIIAGNEGDDWLEGGNGHDLVQGDNALTFQNDPYGGADVFFGGAGNDDHDAEGGDDIMLNNGIDRHGGMLGFDWVIQKHDPVAGDADLSVSVLQPVDEKNMRSRFLAVEGLSGWDKPDILRGSSIAADAVFTDRGDHVLTQAHLDRIVGLREMLGGGDVPQHAEPFMSENDANNILLGGADSDLIEGRGGDDYIDGDAMLDVYLVGPGGERQESMHAFQDRIFSGALRPTDIEIVREIVTPTGQDDVIDTAVYADVTARHVVTENSDGTWTVEHTAQDAETASGVDTLRNIERIQFADGTLELVENADGAASGTVRTSTVGPVEDQQLSVIPAFGDPDGVQEDTIEYTWQRTDHQGQWVAAVDGKGESFTPGDAEVGRRLRVVATFLDGEGTRESITSVSTLPVKNVNDEPTGMALSNPTPRVGTVVRPTGLVDNDGTHDANGDATVTFRYQWQQGDGDRFTNISGATKETLTVSAAQLGRRLRVVVSYTDNHGTSEKVTSEATAAVRTAFGANAATLNDIAGNTHEAAIRAIAAAGITAGFPDGTYRPGRTVTRAQMASFLQRALGLSGGDATGFSDVAGHAHEAAIRAITAAGITTGFSDGTYRPGDTVTRAQMATFLKKALSLTDGDASRFSDVAGNAHEAAIGAIAEAGITTGFPDGSYRPAQSVTRGQMATFLQKALNL